MREAIVPFLGVYFLRRKGSTDPRNAVLVQIEKIVAKQENPFFFLIIFIFKYCAFSKAFDPADRPPIFHKLRTLVFQLEFLCVFGRYPLLDCLQ